MEDAAEADEKAARAAQSMDRVMSLRVSLFSMMFSFVVDDLTFEDGGISSRGAECDVRAAESLENQV